MSFAATVNLASEAGPVPDWTCDTAKGTVVLVVGATVVEVAWGAVVEAPCGEVVDEPEGPVVLVESDE